MQTKSEEIPEGTIPRLYHALFMVKEDWDAKPLQEHRKSLRTLRKPTESLKSELRTNLVKCVMTLREEWRLKTSL